MWQKIRKSVVIAIFFAASAAIAPVFGQQLDDGKQVFSSTCASCHGLDGKGAERGPDIVKRRAIQQLSDDSLFRIVRDGKRGTGMPPFRTLGEDRIQAVVHYLRELQGQGAAVALPGDPKAGKVVFFGKGECSRCHTAGGQSGFIASDLSNVAAAKDAASIRTAITDPNKNLDPRSRVVVLKTVDGSSFSGIARNEDNFSLQLQTLDGAFHFFNKQDLQSVEHQPRSHMPADYAGRLSSQELDNLVAYVMSLAKTHPKQDAEEE